MRFPNTGSRAWSPSARARETIDKEFDERNLSDTKSISLPAGREKLSNGKNTLNTLQPHILNKSWSVTLPCSPTIEWNCKCNLKFLRPLLENQIVIEESTLAVNYMICNPIFMILFNISQLWRVIHVKNNSTSFGANSITNKGFIPNK